MKLLRKNTNLRRKWWENGVKVENFHCTVYNIILETGGGAKLSKYLQVNYLVIVQTLDRVSELSLGHVKSK